MNKYDKLYKETKIDNFDKNNQICNDIINKFQQRYNLPPFDPRLNGINKLFMMLTSNCSEYLINYLEEYDYNYSFELQYLIANFCYLSPNSSFLRLPSVNSIEQIKNGYIVDSKLGRFTFNIASKLFKNLDEFALYGKCHYTCHNFILLRTDVKAVTGLIPLAFCGYQYHSYIEYDDSHILDLSHNCFMDKEEYNKVFQPVFLNAVTANDIDEQERYINNKESLSKDKELLLRLALDKQL